MDLLLPRIYLYTSSSTSSSSNCLSCEQCIRAWMWTVLYFLCVRGSSLVVPFSGPHERSKIPTDERGSKMGSLQGSRKQSHAFHVREMDSARRDSNEARTMKNRWLGEFDRPKPGLRVKPSERSHAGWE